MLLLQGWGREEKKVVEGEGRGTRKRKGQGWGRGQWVIQCRGQPCRVGGLGKGLDQSPLLVREGMARVWGGYRLGGQAVANSPMTKTGMKAPQGTGMVVASADIQNCRQEAVQTSRGAPPGEPVLLISRNDLPRYPRIPRGERKGKDSGTRWLGFESLHNM